MRVFVIAALVFVLMLSSCASQRAFTQIDGAGTPSFDCERAQSCDENLGGSASMVGLGILVVAAAIGVGALVHELVSRHRSTAGKQ
jgi:hypothetical protein